MKTCIYCKELVKNDHSDKKCIPKVQPDSYYNLHHTIDYSKFCLNPKEK